jgi:hypothetical protein
VDGITLIFLHGVYSSSNYLLSTQFRLVDSRCDSNKVPVAVKNHLDLTKVKRS